MNKQRKYCKLCPHVEMWMSLRHLMAWLELGVMPCGHDWLENNDKWREMHEMVEAMSDE